MTDDAKTYQLIVRQRPASGADLDGLLTRLQAEYGLDGYTARQRLLGVRVDLQEPDLAPRFSIYIRGQIGLSNSLPDLGHKRPPRRWAAGFTAAVSVAQGGGRRLSRSDRWARTWA